MADSSAREQAQQATGAATEKGREVAEHAKGQAGAVAGTAREQAGQVAGEARERAMTVLSDASSQVQEQADTQAQRLVGTFRDTSRQLRAMADGSPEPGMAMDLTRQAGQMLEGWASRIDEGGVQGALSDLQRYARRRPGAFLLGAGVAGFFTGRLLRNVDLNAVKEAATGGSDTPPQPVGEVGMGQYSPIDAPLEAMDAGEAAGGDISVLVPGGTTTVAADVETPLGGVPERGERL